MRKDDEEPDESGQAADPRIDLDQPWATIEAYVVAQELIDLLTANNGWVGEGGLRTFRDAYRRFDDDNARIFRARLTAHLARIFAKRSHIPFPLAAGVIDAWFPPREPPIRGDQVG